MEYKAALGNENISTGQETHSKALKKQNKVEDSYKREEPKKETSSEHENQDPQIQVVVKTEEELLVKCQSHAKEGHGCGDEIPSEMLAKIKGAIKDQ